MKRAISILAAIAFVVCISACNTTRGVGRDIEKVGEGIKDSADKHGAD